MNQVLSPAQCRALSYLAGPCSHQYVVSSRGCHVCSTQHQHQAPQLDDTEQGKDNAAHGPVKRTHGDAAARFSAAFGSRVAGSRPNTDLLDAVAPGSTTQRGRALASVAAVAQHLFNREVVFVKFEGPAKFNAAVLKSLMRGLCKRGRSLHLVYANDRVGQNSVGADIQAATETSRSNASRPAWTVADARRAGTVHSPRSP